MSPVLILLLSSLILLFISIPIHEFVHWIQAKLDTRVEPISINYFWDCGDPAHFACVKMNWTTNDLDQQQAYSSIIENSQWEISAYSTQILFIVLGTIIVMRFIL